MQWKGSTTASIVWDTIGYCYVSSASVVWQSAAFFTCVFAGELGLGVAHPLGALAAFLVGPVLTVLVSVAPPAFWDAGSICDAVKFLSTALDDRRQHWKGSRSTITVPQIRCTLLRAKATRWPLIPRDSFCLLKIFIVVSKVLDSISRSVSSKEGSDFAFNLQHRHFWGAMMDYNKVICGVTSRELISG